MHDVAAGSVMTAGALIHGSGVAALMAPPYASRTWGYLAAAVGCFVIAAGELLIQMPAVIAVRPVLVGLLWLWMWRKTRRRRRALRSLGNKARARLAAMISRLRDTLRPRPALQPTPGGV